MNWIGLVKLDVGLDLFGLDWMNWIGLMFGIWYLDVFELDLFGLDWYIDWYIDWICFCLDVGYIGLT